MAIPLAPVALIAVGVGALLYGKKTPKPTGTTPASHQASAAGAPVGPLTAAVITSGKAVASSKALYSYLKANGPNKSADLANLVLTFQKASNSDPDAIVLAGPLAASSVYDQPTSAALTMYTHDPIPPAADVPKPPLPSAAQSINYAQPGAAAQSGFNLYTYLKNKGNDHSKTLITLTKTFQHDFNTDPKAAGPASNLVKIMTVPLVEDGNYGSKTADALAIGSGDRIAP